MDLGLCMVVRNEAHRLVDCLAPIVELLDQIEIVDTGSDDGTPELLRERFGIHARSRPIEEHRCRCLCDARHAALERLSTPWILMLDADERIAPQSLQAFRARAHEPGTAGYFARWVNRLEGEPAFDDYKLFLFRNGLRPIGLVHDVVQLDIRARGLRAAWLDDFEVQHHPDTRQRVHKAARYRQRLLCALDQDPEFHRYRWFLGYMDYLDGREQAAIDSLSVAADAESPRFPVECLNSAMVLAELYAQRADEAALGRVLQRARIFFQQVRDDFEVQVNVCLGPWLDTAWAQFCGARWDEIRAYRFAC